MAVQPDGAFVCPTCGAVVRLTEFTGGYGPSTASKSGTETTRLHYVRVRVRFQKAQRNMAPRNAGIVAMHEAGHSLRAIAAAYEISRQSVAYVLDRQGVRPILSIDREEIEPADDREWGVAI